MSPAKDSAAAEVGDKRVAQPGGWVDMKRRAHGGIATGKSVVRAELERLGVPTIDADVVARDRRRGHSSSCGDSRTVRSRRPRRRWCARPPEAGVDRVRGRSRARDLEQIVHPAVKAAIDTWLDAMSGTHNIAVAVIPLLTKRAGRETSMSSSRRPAARTSSFAA